MIRHASAALRARKLPAARAFSFVLALLVTAIAGAALPAVARAEDCPENVPNSSRERRAIAKDWFSRAEAADAGGDPIGAVRAYQCSLKMVPHAFTAFNLGRLAERTGDLELAVDAFNTYIKLAPEAPDRKEIEEKVARIGERINKLREEQTQAATPAVPPPPKPTTPEPPLEVKTPPPTETLLVTPDQHDESSSAVKVAPWIVGGVGVAALAGGLLLNFAARGKMEDCRAQANRGESFESTCDAAKPLAYGSYALFGVAAAAAVTDALLLTVFHKDGGSEGAERRLSAAPLPGGAAVYGRFRF
jgi:tetratricopeptide (TPR) repeat protein